MTKIEKINKIMEMVGITESPISIHTDKNVYEVIVKKVETEGQRTFVTMQRVNAGKLFYNNGKLYDISGKLLDKKIICIKMEAFFGF